MIIIPMMGLSSRFTNAGFKVPKYQLPLWGSSVFENVLLSFKKYFESDLFLFITPATSCNEFITPIIQKLGLKNKIIITLEHHTSGQAESVFLALKQIDQDESLYIFNIDTILHAFTKDETISQNDGYLEVFEGEGNHWSFIKVDNGLVTKVTEKERISNLCCNGLYYFKSKNLFNKLYTELYLDNENVLKETYVAPLFNQLIINGGNVAHKICSIKDIDFCGTPEEYSALISTNHQQPFPISI